MVMSALSVVLLFVALASFQFRDGSSLAETVNDTFTLDNETDWDNHVYAPQHWSFVTCHDVDSCPGWPTNWENYNDFIPYDGSENMCKDCSEHKTGVCDKHQQSPIPLEKMVTDKRECKDRHRMNYVEGTCKFGMTRFQILPHVLRAYTPDTCGVLPLIDYSMGFPVPWIHKFTDIIVPSLHTQDGERYAAEVVLSHVYSADKVGKLIGNVAVLLQEGEESDHFDFLQLFWKKFKMKQTKIKEDCERRRLGNTRGTNSGGLRSRDRDSASDETDEDNLDEFWTSSEDQRELEDDLEPDYVDFPPHYVGPYHPYIWVKETHSEYYFRYNGSMYEPPCFEGVHWRVLKNPIKIAPSQAQALAEIFASRIDPVSCDEETAGRPRNDGSGLYDYNRPMQIARNSHKMVYCECVDWSSPKKADKAYCALSFEDRGVSNRTWPTPIPTTSPIGPTDLPTTKEPTPEPTPEPSPEPSTASPTECVCEPPEGQN